MIPRRIFVLIDACLVTAAFIIAHALTPLLRPARQALVIHARRLAPSQAQYFPLDAAYLAPLSQLLWMLVVIIPAVLLALLALDAYGRLGHMSRTRMLLAGPFASGVGLSLATLVIFLLRIQEWSRVFIFAFAALTAVSLTGVRAFIRAYHQWQTKVGYYRRNLLLVGSEKAIGVVVGFMQSHWTEGDSVVIGHLAALPSPVRRDYAVAGPSAPQSSMTADGRPAVLSAVESMATDITKNRVGSPLTSPCLGSALEIATVLLHHPVHEVVVISENDADDWIREVMRACDHVGVPLRLIPNVLLSSSLANLVVTDDLRYRKKVPAILLAPRVWDTEALHIKRLVDVILSLVALVVFAPLFAIVALLIRLSGPGPILHRYYMVGQNGTHFIGHKFRTMVPNAHALKAALLTRNEMTGPVFKMKDDPRVTRIGRWLRKFSLDELPQLYSVVKGDLSLVGPRPAGPDEFERFEFWHMRKVSVRPGITCLWQVRGRNAISSFDEWVKMDLEYIDNWSLWLDFKILARTCLVVIKGTGR